MRRAFWILITPLAGFLVLWLLGSLVVGPRVETWLLTKIQDYSESSLPVTIRAQSLQLHFFKPSLGAQGIEITPKGEMAQYLKPVRVGSARVFLDLFTLLGGRVHLSAVVVDSPEVELDLDPLMQGDEPAKALPIDEIFAQLEKVPLQRLFLRNLQFKTYSKKLQFETSLDSGDLLVSNNGKNLSLRTSVPSLHLDLKKIGTFEGSLDSQLELTRQALRVHQLGVRLDQSEVVVKGEINPISQVTLKPQGSATLTGKINLKDIYDELHRLRPDLKVPAFQGQLALESDLQFKDITNVRGKAEVNTQDVVVGQFQLGNARIQGEYKDERISLSEIRLQHPAGEAKVTRSEISLKNDHSFKAQLSVANLDLQKLFASLSLGSIPVGMNLQGTIPCEGHLRPEILVTCDQVKVSAKDIWVKSGMDKKATAILDLNQMDAEGKVQITTAAVNYTTQLTMGSSTGTSQGVIDFEKGFKINYATRNLNFKDVKNLANLKMQGQAEIEGSTSGDTEAAIFGMRLNARNFVFENFTLGNVVSNVSYKNANLFFEDIAGAIDRTQYIGELNLDLEHSRLQGEFSIPTAELADVATVFQDIYRLPFGIQGQGAARAQVSGPLDFWKMNYKLESAFKQVLVGGESFDTLTFNASANQGNINADNVILTKGDATLKLRGGISSNQIMNLYADGQNWRLEQSDIISKINSNIVGGLNFAAELKEAVSSPHITVKGAITDTSFEEQELPNSNFLLNIYRDLFGAEVSLFGNRVQGSVQFPFEGSRKPLQIKVTTNEWNFSSLLSLVGGANLAGEYDSSVTSKIDITSETGSLLKASGQIQIDKFALKRGALSLSNPAPINISLNAGRTNIRNFLLTGPNTNVQVRGENFTPENLNMDLGMQVDMRLLQIFTPFLEDLGGGLNVATKISGSWQKPQVLGNLDTKNVYLKLKGLPHPIERLSIDVVFSQSRVLISSIRGIMAGGTLSGDGGVMIEGIRNIPTSVRLRLEGVTFNVPDKVRSSGHADLLFSGRWFPFTLSGTYYISNALMEKEVTDDGGGVGGVRQSVYLPKVIRESSFEPLLLDLQLLMEKQIQVKNSLLDGSVAGNLQVKGPPDNPVLLGRITTMRNSKLIFKDKIFEIQNGIIDFNDPDEINPNLYITATARIDEYDVTVLAQGTAKNLTIRLSSVPPLPENDIISLIALGVTRTAMDQNVQSRQQAEQLGVEIGGAVLAKPIDRAFESTLGLNFAVTNQYDSTRQISVPKLTLSRRLTDKFKVSASRPVRDTQAYDFRLEYQINSNVNAVGSYENRGLEENQGYVQTIDGAAQNVFGLDLEFKREFK